MRPLTIRRHRGCCATSLAILPSVGALKSLRVFAATVQDSRDPFVGFADPILTGASVAESDRATQQLATRGLVEEVSEVRQLEPLPETQSELNEIAKALGANPAFVFVRDQATERRVKSMDLSQTRVIAFATHALTAGSFKGYATALRLYRPLAEQGNARAQSDLGAMYGKGHGVPQDYTAAVSWYRKAAEQGDREAQHYLGIMYALGQGVPQDYVAAASWYQKAAHQGDPRAQNNLGTMYIEGKGVPQDYVLAHVWFNLAASAGNAMAINNRNNVAKKMTPAQIAAAQKLAREW